jgi:hypothetical protein
MGRAAELNKKLQKFLKLNPPKKTFKNVEILLFSAPTMSLSRHDA